VIGLSDMKEWLGEPSEPGVDSLLVSLEERAVDLVESETERHFGGTETFEEHLEGDGTRTLYLNENPTSLASVEERQFVGDSWTAVTGGDSDGWELRAPKSPSGTARVLRKKGHVWTYGWEYRVTYDFGYSPGNEPPEIRQAVMDLVALKYHERGREGLRSASLGDHSYTTLADGMGRRDLMAVPGLERTLRRWRRSRRTVG
jgi:hypothetical protein